MWPFKKTQQQQSVPRQHKASRKYNNNNSTNVKRDLDNIRNLPNQILGQYGNGVNNVSINAVLRQTLTSVRDACRSLTIQNPYARRYVQLSSQQTVGADGITVRPQPLAHDGSVNQVLADSLDKMFYEWASNADFSFDGSMSIDIFQQVVERTRATDGECFIRIHRTNNKVQVELIDSARIPSTKNELLDNGSYISNGIEFNEYDQVQAYWVAKVHPLNYTISTNDLKRIPADEIIHYFIPEFPKQQRGIPDLIASIKTLNDFNSYHEAAIIQKRLASSAMAFITSTDNNQDELLNNDDDESRESIEYFQAGTIYELNSGQNIQTVNPQAGTDKITEFSDSVLTTISTGLGIPKSMLTGDTQNASFSAAKMADRINKDGMKTKSNLMISKVLKPIYRLWLQNQMLNSFLNLSFLNFENTANCTFVLPKAISLDPNKDASYEETLLNMGVKSKAMVMRDLGYEPQRVFEEIQQEREQERLINKDMEINNNNVQGKELNENEKTNEGDQSID
ncbi:phage portal protein%2C lambda family [Yersinia rohdei]|uniref:Phage portal protein, lambda family n=1 Tax=Yersinia rohdei TaxID=29485 RepID=A0A0U1HUP3_YERRO|nr:phage portal protein [Yersinia rohdei]CQI92585.1 phage portal protein%2C lambda family [Yersinia rohdei]